MSSQTLRSTSPITNVPSEDQLIHKNADMNLVLTGADGGRFLILRIRSSDGATRSVDVTVAIQRSILSKWLREHPAGE